MRAISRWLSRAASSVETVVCRCRFKTFTPDSPQETKGEGRFLPRVLRKRQKRHPIVPSRDRCAHDRRLNYVAIF